MGTRTITATLPSINRGRRYRYDQIASKALSYALVILAAFVFIYPILILVSISLKPNWEIYRNPLSLFPSQVQFDTYQTIFQTTPVPRYLFNSVLYAVSGSLITIVFSLLAAYGLSRHVFAGKRLFLTFLLVIQLVPGLVRVIPLFVMMSSLGMTDSRLGIILLYGAGGIAYGTWFLKGYFDALPKEMDEAAWIDGASKLRTIWQILLPSLVPGLAALAILQFIGHWNDFTTASVLLRAPDLQPLTVGTYRLIGPDEADFRLLASAALVNIVPVILVFSILQRYLVSGLSAGAVKA